MDGYGQNSNDAMVVCDRQVQSMTVLVINKHLYEMPHRQTTVLNTVISQKTEGGQIYLNFVTVS